MQKKAYVNDISPHTIGIYLLVNKVNGKTYVGQSRDIQFRISDHFRPGTNTLYVDIAINKYGKDNFSYFILETFDEINLQQIDEAEIFWIKQFNSNSNLGYNRSPGGNPNLIRGIDSWNTDKSTYTFYHVSGVVESNITSFELCSKYKIPHSRFRKIKNNPMQGTYGWSLSPDYKPYAAPHNIGNTRKVGKFNQIYYTFVNTITKESFSGNQRDFMEKVKCRSERISCLVHKKLKHYKNWIIIENENIIM